MSMFCKLLRSYIFPSDLSILSILPTPYCLLTISSLLSSMGSESGGNDFPGVARPFGMVKIGPDLYQSGSDAYSGYLPTGEFSGFSLMHEQGTGGAPKYGTVSQLPLVGNNISDPLSQITVARNGIDEGSVGYYKATTGQSVEVELSASSRAGIYRYNFPGDSAGNNILVDVSHVLPSFRGMGLGQNYKGGNLTIFDDGHYEGLGTYDNGWNEAPNWSIYFCESSLVLRGGFLSSLIQFLISYRWPLRYKGREQQSIHGRRLDEERREPRRRSFIHVRLYKSRRAIYLRRERDYLPSRYLLDLDGASMRQCGP